MKPTEPLQLFHSWPLSDVGRRFELGRVGDHDVLALDDAVLAHHGVGQWECDLSNNKLTWSDTVYDLFGLPRGSSVARDAVVTQYCEGSRTAMERLRAYTIRHVRGFTLDAEIRRTDGTHRWMRLVAAPVCVDDRVVRLVGTKRLLVN